MHVDKSFTKIQARVRPPPHSGNACILGLSSQATPPLAEDDDDEDGEDYSDDDDDQANDEDGEDYSDDDAHYGVMIVTLEYIFPTELIKLTYKTHISILCCYCCG